MGGSTHHVDYDFPALQSRVGGGGRLPLLYNSTGHSLRIFLMTGLLKITADPLQWTKEFSFFLTTAKDFGDLSCLC